MSASCMVEVLMALAPWQPLQHLLDASYPRPPRDMFERLVMYSPHSNRAD